MFCLKKKAAYMIINDYIVDAEVTMGIVNCWLYHKEYGIKMHMFGIQFEGYTKLQHLIEKVIDSYIDQYTELYMQD